MKKILLVLATLLVAGCSSKQPKEIIKYVTVKDNSDSIEYVSKIVALDYKLSVYEDSIVILNERIVSSNDSIRLLQGDVLALKYKIERIRYYNKIAASGNNIKYLRGWINRVIE